MTETWPRLWGWTPTKPATLYVILDCVAKVCELPITLTDWGDYDADDCPDFTPWEQALFDFETLYQGNAAIDWPSPNAQRWCARREGDPSRFDRWAAELGYGALGLAKMAANGSGSHDRDVARHRAEADDLRRRLGVLTHGPLEKRRWRRPREDANTYHWQSIAVPPWRTEQAVGIDEGIVDLIEQVWRVGFRTAWCCQRAYISFGSPSEARSFATIISSVGGAPDVDGSTVSFDPELIGPATQRLRGQRPRIEQLQFGSPVVQDLGGAGA